MAQTNVSSCVLSIVASFSSGLDVFKKLREKRKRKRSSSRSGHGKRRGTQCDAKAVVEEEARLSRSLRQGPEDIGREYAQSVYAVGDGFAIGDALAQTSLAEILLKLNTGLVGIISSFLNSDRKNDMQLDYQALTQLSDRSRIDTCRALRQLFKRMTQPKPLPLPLPAVSSYETNESAETRATDDRPKRKRKHSASHAKVKGPTLARVVIQDSSKRSQIAMVKPSERRKKSSSTSSSGSELSKASSTPSTPPPEYAPEPPPRPVAVRSKTAPAVPAKTGRKAEERESQVRQAARSTGRLATMLEHQHLHRPNVPPQPPFLPPRANPAAQSTPVLAHRTRKPTPTYYSIASDSTRLGEIPLHKWNVAPDFDRMELLNREAEVRGWPAGEMGVEVGGGKRGWGLRRLFGKK